MDESKSVSTPVGAHFKLSSLDDAEAETNMEDIPYANAIGSIMYAMIGTRCDLGYGLGLVSRFLSKPGMVHWTAVKWVLRYLKGTQDLKLCFRKNEAFKVEGFYDSDFSSDLDKRMSISGYIFMAGGNTISWRSSLQSVVALSTTEAKYMALVEAVKEGMWLRGLAEELGFKQDTVEISCDSQSALCLAKNNVYHERTKHISRKMHFIRDIIAQGDVSVKKICTSKNHADILTKVVPVKKFEEEVDFLGMSEH
ncbi:secreted RxLR effector protein 161-like [Brassica napus]|uniref:secreted RxLR effector protein 161-like n=1 Tax=Brassica napus TaxID=3708 RepID=UPI002079C8A4|nr:secreted RxLR effector protein 161-like [Brassica napus]